MLDSHTDSESLAHSRWMCLFIKSHINFLVYLENSKNDAFYWACPFCEKYAGY